VALPLGSLRLAVHALGAAIASLRCGRPGEQHGRALARGGAPMSSQPVSVSALPFNPPPWTKSQAQAICQRFTPLDAHYEWTVTVYLAHVVVGTEKHYDSTMLANGDISAVHSFPIGPVDDAPHGSLGEPEWRRVTRAQVEQLLGQPFPELGGTGATCQTTRRTPRHSSCRHSTRINGGLTRT
jgi:hypothetical protein